MSKWIKLLSILVIASLVLALLGPFLVPLPPLADTRPERELADPDSQFIRIGDLDVHYKERGAGEPALILLHGFASSTFSWREVMEPLSADRRVVAYDRPAFGLTSRPMPEDWQGENPYAPQAQVDLAIGLMDALGIEKAILVGNSAGGTSAVRVALAHPDRIQALILVSPAIYAGGGAPGFLRPLFKTPQIDRLGPLLARSIQSQGIALGRAAWHDPSRLTDEIWSEYTKPLQANNWDRALWEFTKASGESDLAGQLDRLTLPVLVITGDDDRVVPTEQSVRLAGELPNAELVVIPQCGHVAHEECPQAFLEAVNAFLGGL